MGNTITSGVQAGPKQERSKQTREKIIRAAIELFQELGYEKTTSNEIASAAGVSVGSFYVYFTDKRQLLLTIFDRLADELFKNVFESLKPEHLFDSELRPSIKQAISNAIKDKQKRAGLHRVIYELVLKDSEFAARHKALTERSISKLKEIISLAQKAGLTRELDIEAATFIVHRAVLDISQDYVMGCVEFDQERAIDSLTDMVYRFLFKPREAVA
ncbi:MAG TPA: TetR/AcrR family transcriptional regulator [Blastocatellia bacterium]|nr:TetR/AcrR family transcriptional regulator [Blastocatellia bacterium]